MALSEVSYPVTGAAGTYQNVFPSQKPVYAEFKRIDEVITIIVSGTDNRVRMSVAGSFLDVAVGQFVTWGTDGYTINSAKVTAIIAVDTIEVDLQFTTSIVTNGFVNYFRNYFLEIRYVVSDSASNDQDATELIEDHANVPNNKEGDIRANISLPADLLVPEFSLTSGLATGLSTTYKIQFRESYDGNREGLWVSPTLDVSIMLVHGTKDIESGVFPDEAVTKRYIKGYPMVYSLTYSGVNDSGTNNFAVSLTQFDLGKNVLLVSELSSIANLNGVYVFVLDTNTFEDSTAFVQFSYLKTTNNGQYDPTQYDPTQYA